MRSRHLNSSLQGCEPMADLSNSSNCFRDELPAQIRQCPSCSLSRGQHPRSARRVPNCQAIVRGYPVLDRGTPSTRVCPWPRVSAFAVSVSVPLPFCPVRQPKSFGRMGLVFDKDIRHKWASESRVAEEEL
eukprot:108873-Amphidinium_carterae.1